MDLERSMNDQFLSNTYLVGKPGEAGFLVDAGGPVQPLLDHGVEITHVLLTHHHWDHVCELPQIKERFPKVHVLIEPREFELLDEQFKVYVTDELPAGDIRDIAGHEVKALHTPGHTRGMLSLLVDETDVFTGDTLFKGSVGGVRAPGSTSFADIKHSIMDVLMGLPAETVVRPGHTDPTTIRDEYENNRFIRVWRGVDPEGDEPCTALDEPATLVLLGDDYDGGHKAWVRWPDGRDDIVPGSKVTRG
jgi:glyoxylase-like metal-dependent hydrolase (beta-lactamase superfamily II)